MGKTLYEKIWDAHVVEALPSGDTVLYIDRHLVHEVTSPQAFDGLRLAGRKVRRPDLTFATADHNVPTTADRFNIEDVLSKAQITALERNWPSRNGWLNFRSFAAAAASSINVPTWSVVAMRGRP